MKRKTLKGMGALFAVAALVVSNVGPISGGYGKSVSADETYDWTYAPNPGERNITNDTDGDGWGEFQGFGTSLCWWANRVGYSDTLASQAAEMLYDKENGLGLSIARYNIGGGDDPTHNHIQRSDSVIPGYCTDITAITTKEEAEGFDRYDLDCGYAWNYDWDADANQINVLKKAQEEVGDEIITEAFSNSPPYFMTESGCSSGGENGAENLRKDSYKAFATYLADVVEHLNKEGFNITSISPMNEPTNGQWAALSAKQEGCTFYAGESQSNMFVTLDEVLNSEDYTTLKDMIIAGPDDVGPSKVITDYNSLTDEAKAVLDRVDTHEYETSEKSADLYDLVSKDNKNIWMSEVDGSGTAGTGAGEMSAGIYFSNLIRNQIYKLQPSAWIMWDAIDGHADTTNEFDRDSFTAADMVSMDTSGFWGIAIANHDEEKIYLSKKYYSFGQYSKYVRPGYTIIATNGSNSQVTAYDRDSKTLVMVVVNWEKTDKSVDVNLNNFIASDDTSVKVVRTSGTLADGENWADVTDNGETAFDDDKSDLITSAKANSVTTYIISNIDYTGEARIEATVAPVTTAAPTTTATSAAVATTAPTSSDTSATKPAKTKIKSVKAAKKKVTVSWEKVSDVKGYRVIVNTKNSLKGGKTKNVAASKNKVTVSGLKAKTKYFVFVQSYALDADGNKVYSAKVKKKFKTK